MMTTMRLRLAGLLRRIANRLDPYDPDPLLFVPSGRDVVRAMRGGGPVQEPPPPPPAGAN